ncbi:30S ribosomal protein S9 [Candidatus Kaiserbacteria bacterium]|nr:30S ribosomal protein S9 [Candidatus Kaiserbacteria bacterium]
MPETKKVTNTEKYKEGIGRRKTATARVRLTPAKERAITVNGKSLAEYFRSPALEHAVLLAFSADETLGNYEVSAHVSGGGIRAQGDAIKLGIARALVKEKPERRTELKQAGLLMRDPRSKERRKFGLKKARKAPQWSKR